MIFSGLLEGLHKKRDTFQRLTVPGGWSQVRWSFNGLLEGVHKKRDIFHRLTVPGGWPQVRWSFTGSLEGVHKKRDIFQWRTVPGGWPQGRDLPMAYSKDCTKRETFFNVLQYLEVGLAAMRWPPLVKWSSVKSRDPSYQHWRFYFYKTSTILLNISL